MSIRSPLERIRVLDLSRVLALPYATMILSDLGAEVIKVERPGVGDETRHWGPPFLGTESAYFLCVNRNKKSITVDIKSKEGQKIIKELVKKCDVVVENFRVGELKKYGLDYESLKKENSRIIYCSLTGYGQTGPKKGLPGYDFVMQGESGLMSITGHANGQPMKTGVAILDVVSGLYAAISILSAIIKRDKTGQSEHIDLSLLDCSVSALVNVASNYLVSGRIPKRYGNAHPNIVPYQTFKAKDKYFNLAVGNDNQFRKLVEILDDEKLKDEKFKTNAGRVRNRKELIKILQGIFAEKEASYWVDIFTKNNIPVGLINNLKEVFEDEQIVFRDMVKTLDHKMGKLMLVGSPIKLKESKLRDFSPPPTLGEHTEEILKHLIGYDEHYIKILKENGVI